MPKRKSAAVAEIPQVNGVPPPDLSAGAAPPSKRRVSKKAPQLTKEFTNPDENSQVLDGSQALRASPDAEGRGERLNVERAGIDGKKQVKEDEPPLDKASSGGSKKKMKKDSAKNKSAQSTEKEVKIETAEGGEPVTTGKAPSIKKEPQNMDPEADGEEEADEQEIAEASTRPPPVHSDYLPLPWKGRLGYACLCTYLRFANPPVFSSRTCRIASILENRHPLKDPNAPPHPTKNRPDKDKPADKALGQAFVEGLGKANARDIVKMLRWNDKYGIKFLRLSSEMFPFASHEEYGYKLAPFVSEELAEAGRLAAELGHRLTTHPGQYTQLGSPRKQVIDNAIRDLEYHAELLDLLKLPPQQDRDAVMILHLGGVFGDKEATLNRFRENYGRLAANIKKRLVLENDDVSWSVHDLLPVCEELNIPMVLDFHHHNIIFDSEKLREGTKDIVHVFPRILATWKRKNITPKMHYSEPTPSAITGRQRRKHNPRVATLPPCPPDMDLMIEAKDKEQAVFELMRTFKLPGYERFSDIIPHARQDENKPIRPPRKSPKKKSKKVKTEEETDDTIESAEEPAPELIPDEEVSMGGPEGRVYWPPGQEEWLRPKKRVVKPKEPKSDSEPEKKLTPAQKKKAAEAAAKEGAKVEEEVQANGVKSEDGSVAGTPTPASRKKAPAKPRANGTKGKKKAREETPATTDEEDEDEVMQDLGEEEDEEPAPTKKKAKVNGTSKGGSKRRSGRAKQVQYAEASDDEDE